jgi:hypothetical protein
MGEKNRSEPQAAGRPEPLLPPPQAPARRERQTLVPHFDPEALAREIEAASDRPTITPPYDPSAYARIVDGHVNDASAAQDSARTVTAVTPARSEGSPDDELAIDGQTSDTLGRAMYGSYLQSDYPEALVLAERVLEREPEHALAQLVVDGCRARLGSGAAAPRLVPSSVVRLKRPRYEVVERVRLESDLTSQIVIGHLDGVADVAMVADLAGIPRPEALDRLHALLELGMLEVVNG